MSDNEDDHEFGKVIIGIVFMIGAGVFLLVSLLFQ